MGMDKSKPLAGIRVVEMTTYLAAPSCGRTLAHLGADVIKVEAPGGDPWRRLGGIYQIPHNDEVNPLFMLGNSGKRFITLDLKTEEGREIMDRLLSSADIFITNMMNKTLKKLHITYEELHEKYPKLVYGRVIGYGEKGAEAERPGFDASAYLARGGLMIDYVEKGTPPNNFMYGAGDLLCGMALMDGLLAALLEAQMGGEGRKVVASLLHTAIWSANMDLVLRQYGGAALVERAYQLKDGSYALIQATTEKQRQDLCRILGLSEAEIKDPKTAYSLLQKIYQEKTLAQWQEIFAQSSVFIEPLAHVRDVPKDPNSLLNGFLLPYAEETAREVNIAMPPVQVDGETGTLLGEIRRSGSTCEIMRELGYTEEEIAALCAAGAAEAAV